MRTLVSLALWLVGRGWFRSVPKGPVLWLGPWLAYIGTPDACLLAIHLSNFSGAEWPVATRELFTNACCEFGDRSGSGSGDQRTIEIVRAKFLWPVTNNEPATPVAETVSQQQESSNTD